ncbi:ATP-binding cassette sub- A member 5 [Chytriomyces hyalinus]|nr:ATP-binding cassette sub- A member 5 [Chytriomyces hyalinus]
MAPQPHVLSSHFHTAQKFNWFGQFAALVRWNLINKTREPARLIEAVYNFILYMVLLVVLNRFVFSKAGSVSVTDMIQLSSLCPSDVPACIPLAYVTPNSSLPSSISRVVNEIKSLAVQSEPASFADRIMTPFASRDALTAYKKANPSNLFVAIEFYSFNETSFDTAFTVWVPDYSYFTDGSITSGYVTAQAYIERAVLNVQRSGQLPNAAKLSSPLLYNNGNGIRVGKMSVKSSGLLITLVLYIIFTFHAVSVSLFIRTVSAESKILKPGMLVMGLDETAYASAMFAAQLVFTIPSAIIAVPILCLGANVFVSTSWAVVLIGFVLYVASLNSFSYCLVACFPVMDEGASTGIGFLSMFGSMAIALLGQFLIFSSATTSRSSKMLFQLVPQAAITQFLSQTQAQENNNVPVTLGNLSSFPDIQDAVVMLLLDVFVWIALGFLATLFRKQFLQKHGDNVPADVLANDGAHERPEADIQPVDFSAIPFEARDVVRVIKVAKAFQKKSSEETKKGQTSEPAAKGKRWGGKKGKKYVTALKGVSIDLHRGQTLALLGHNGAGKTTLLSVLYGQEKPSAGQVLVKVPDEHGNYSVLDAAIDKDMVRIRQNLGVCPQFDVLFQSFTPREHLRLYAGLKGITVKDANNQADPSAIPAYIEALLSDVGVFEKADTAAKNLSGGQKRKLSLAIALLGNPALILLDEPTTGMDAGAVEQVWRLLEYVKQGRTIIITTHSMEEADTLGDRIAILSHGSFQAIGTSMFLKGKFGVGYHLNVDFSDVSGLHALLEVVKKTFHEAQVEDERVSRNVAKISLPRPTNLAQSEYSALLADLFDTLHIELSKNNLVGVESLGLSQTTLEQVFLKLREEDEKAENATTGLEYTKPSPEFFGAMPSNTLTILLLAVTCACALTAAATIGCYPPREAGITYEQGTFASHLGANYVMIRGEWRRMEACGDSMASAITLCYPAAMLSTGSYLPGAQAHAMGINHVLDESGIWQPVAPCQYRNGTAPVSAQPARTKSPKTDKKPTSSSKAPHGDSKPSASGVFKTVNTHRFRKTSTRSRKSTRTRHDIISSRHSYRGTRKTVSLIEPTVLPTDTLMSSADTSAPEPETSFSSESTTESMEHATETDLNVPVPTSDVMESPTETTETFTPPIESSVDPIPETLPPNTLPEPQDTTETPTPVKTDPVTDVTVPPSTSNSDVFETSTTAPVETTTSDVVVIDIPNTFSPEPVTTETTTSDFIIEVPVSTTRTPTTTNPVVVDVPGGYTPLPKLYAGVNCYFIYSLTRGSQIEILSALQQAGVKTVRIFITSFNSGGKGTDAVGSSDLELYSPGTYDDSVLGQIDELMPLLVQYGIRLSIAMHDRWNLDSTWGICDAYCSAYCNGGSNLAGFYNNQAAQNSFDARLAHIVNHVNPKMGNRAWKDIPEAIFSFDIQNEGQGNTNILNADWWCGRATALRRVIGDSRVLIGTGGGQDFYPSLLTQNFECGALDIVAMHTYNNDINYVTSNLQNAASLANTYNKRIEFQEFGATGGGKSGWIGQVASLSNSLGIPWLPWEVSKPGIANDYEFWTDDTAAWGALTQYARAASGA